MSEVLKHLEVVSESKDVDYPDDENAEKVAAALGLVVVYPKPNELQLDLDSDAAYKLFAKRFAELDLAGKGVTTKTCFSKSGHPHRHVTVVFAADVVFDEWQRLALQSALGSDPIREYLNTKRLMEGVPHPSRLFMKPDNAS